jgi:5-methylcytosine-specific restriction protein B
MPTESDIEPDVRAVLRALAVSKNVIISGPPGTGKSRLLTKVREFFEWDLGNTGASPYGVIPLPPATSPIPDWFPSPDRTTSRQSFPTVFDQNTKYRDFMRGLVPKVGQAGDFEVTSGTLYRASLDAAESGHAALVIIDEINRGPAVAAFGSALVGLEADKRLDSDGEKTETTQEFEILGDGGEHERFALPNDLYILAAMNEADTSVEPLDVAFLRRFYPYRLEPSVAVLREHLRLPEAVGVLPETPTSPADLYEALVQAWAEINDQILIGRGAPYRLGQGALMPNPAPISSLADANEYLSHVWAKIGAHVNEVFFGNTRALSDVLRAEEEGSPYKLIEATFAGQSVRRIKGPDRPTPHELYHLLKLIAAE